MQTIEQTIRELKRAIFAGLRDEARDSQLTSYTAKRITLSLALTIEPTTATGEDVRFTVSANPTAADHRINLEFEIPGEEVTHSATIQKEQIQPEQSSVRLEEPETAPESPTVFAALSEIFGAPGFDSSARATVFREVLEELPPLERQEVLLSLENPATPDEEAAITDARHRILRLAESGPAKKGHGPALLRRLAKCEPVQSLMLQAAVHWRTPSDWAAESSPYA
ncbi:MAG: hypothetical protein WCO60_01580 [Verrucomicrobiota bacterium]